MNELWGSAGTDVFAVGDFGTILHYTGKGGNGEPTLIRIASFKETRVLFRREIVVTWATEAETDNAGFNIYRAESRDGKYSS